MAPAGPPDAESLSGAVPGIRAGFGPAGGRSTGMPPAMAESSSAFQEALAAVRVFFQPLVSLRQQRIIGYEALARGPEGTDWESPVSLFAEAEAQGLLGVLESHVWQAALEVWEARFPGLILCLNSHPGTWCRPGDPGGADHLLPVHLLRRRRPRGRLVVEVSERLPLAEPAEVRRQADELRAVGARVWLDDLGAGSAGLQFLPLLRPDGIKLDRVLVAGVDADPYRQSVIRSLMETARELGLTLVAEGVETEAELAWLAALGVDVIQGFLLGYPAPEPRPLAPEAAGLLARLPVPDGREGRASTGLGGPRRRRRLVWPALGALSRSLRQARSLREALGYLGQALADLLAGDGVLILGPPVQGGMSRLMPVPGAWGSLWVVVLDGVLWPSVPEAERLVEGEGRRLTPSARHLGRPRFHADLSLPDPAWKPVYSLGVKLGFSHLLTIPVHAGGPSGLVWAVGWRRPIRLPPELFSIATVMADYTALEWRRWTSPPGAPPT